MEILFTLYIGRYSCDYDIRTKNKDFKSFNTGGIETPNEVISRMAEITSEINNNYNAAVVFDVEVF